MSIPDTCQLIQNYFGDLDDEYEQSQESEKQQFQLEEEVYKSSTRCEIDKIFNQMKRIKKKSQKVKQNVEKTLQKNNEQLTAGYQEQDSDQNSNYKKQNNQQINNSLISFSNEVSFLQQKQQSIAKQLTHMEQNQEIEQQDNKKYIQRQEYSQKTIDEKNLNNKINEKENCPLNVQTIIQFNPRIDTKQQIYTCFFCISQNHMSHHCRQKFCHKCTSQNHIQRECKTNRNECNYCRKRHKNKCGMLILGDQFNNRNYGIKNSKEQIQCLNCQKYGHFNCNTNFDFEKKCFNFDNFSERQRKPDKKQQVKSYNFGKSKNYFQYANFLIESDSDSDFEQIKEIYGSSSNNKKNYSSNHSSSRSRSRSKSKSKKRNRKSSHK